MNHEKRLQLIWKYGNLAGNLFRTTCGLNLELIHPGELNVHAGPDFFNARIKLEQIIWAGNVEVHRRASDWNRHGHHLDPAYDNVILHVVCLDDASTKNSRGRLIPMLKISPSPSQLSRVEQMYGNAQGIPCQGKVHPLKESCLTSCLRFYCIERLEQKIKHVSHIMSLNETNREKALFIAMASGFGLPVNSLPFELMAMRIPQGLLMEIKDSLPDVEALLLGHSGLLLSSKDQGAYASSMHRRYADLKKEVPGEALPPHLWKFLRIRPASFPTLRLSQFASLIHAHLPLTEHFLGFHSITEIDKSFQLSASAYWNTHYVFGKRSPHSVKHMGQQSFLNILINVLLPFRATIRKADHAEHNLSGELEILRNLKPESNHVIKKWINFGIKPCNALESQALIQLYNAYCKQKRCRECQILMMNRCKSYE